ncbi:MAG: hypothetical protein ACRDZ5_07450, partial [Acidimicrobiales bacterium]
THPEAARRWFGAPDIYFLWLAPAFTLFAAWGIWKTLDGSREVLPFRLHLVEIPALDVGASVRRGDRAFGLRLDWLLPFSCFLGCRCPHCGAEDPLVAGRDRLGCRACLPRALTSVPARPPAAQSETDAPAPPDERPPKSAPGAGVPPGDDRSPGGALRDKRAGKVWYGVAKGFWQAVGRSERYGSVAPRSPLDALYRCYGPRGPLHAVGLPSSALLRAMSADLLDHDADVLWTGGVLRTSDGVVRFTLRWRLSGREPSVVEVLPLRPKAGERSLPTARRGHDLSGAVPGPEAPRPGGLGPVEALVWQHAIADGLPLVVRSLTLYWRVQGQRRLGTVRAGALAAAVVALARRHSELRGDADWVARRHGVPVAEVRDAYNILDSMPGVVAQNLW